jgi:hypothetical protein
MEASAWNKSPHQRELLMIDLHWKLICAGTETLTFRAARHVCPMTSSADQLRVRFSLAPAVR